MSEKNIFDIKMIVKMRALDETGRKIIEKAVEDGVENVWDRLEKQQLQCGFG